MPATPASPPKRMTRARAKAVEEKAKSTTTTTSTTKVTTAGSRAAAATKSSASKRKTPAEDEAEVPAAAAARATRKVSTKPTVAQSRRGVTAAKLAAEAKSNNEPQEVAKASETKTKGRPRKNTVSRDAPASTTAAIGPATRTRAKAEPAAKTTAAKQKKVAFENANENKENVNNTVSKGNKTLATKPSQPKTTTATGPKSDARKQDSKPNTSRTMPLSPKKESQVAKGNGAGQGNASTVSDAAESDDELELDSGPCVSPGKTVPSLMMNSPAKRPPPSPFKDAMLGSPRRIFMSQAASNADPTATGMSASSMLNQSPRKLKIMSPFKDSQAHSSADGLQSSLLSSPARRPASPSKGLVLMTPKGDRSPRKDGPGSMLASRSPLKFTPAKDVSAEIKAAEVEAIKTRLMSIEEQAAALEDELLNAPSPFSPVKKALQASSPFQNDNMLEAGLAEADALSLEDLEVDDHMDIDVDDIKTPQPINKTFEPRSPQTPMVYEDDSEDELSSNNAYYSTPAARKTHLSSSHKAAETPQIHSKEADSEIQNSQGSFTVLAQKFGQWQAATPDENILKHRQTTRSVFSPLPHLARPAQDCSSVASTSVASTPEPKQNQPASFFDQAMPIQIHEDGDEEASMQQPEEDDMISQETQEYFGQSQMSDASQVYGDENECPIDPALFKSWAAPQVQAEETCTPERVFNEDRPQVIHTVSKVPLKGCDDFNDSPLVVPRKRSQSLAGQLSPHANLELQAMRQIHPSAASTLTEQASVSPGHSLKSGMSQMVAGVLETPRRVTSGGAAAGQATPRADASLLKGAVVFVDVHTTEGADASGLFVDLLTQMGAKCVKSWSWNPRAGSAEDSDGTPPTTPNAKVGITHVVFKDGGKRTMEKVREAHGRVVCVGVGWVLDCERHNQWRDEVDYAIDISTVPRGGHRRRKSMEPNSLSQHNGELFSSTSPRKMSPPQMSPTKEFLNLNSPDRRVSFAPTNQSDGMQTPSTPKPLGPPTDDFSTPQPYTPYAESQFGSPTTPYFLHPAQLVQQTCPPKQTQELFFPVSGKIEEHPDATMRARLLLARRKSLQFAPKVGSPLSRRGDL